MFIGTFIEPMIRPCSFQSTSQVMNICQIYNWRRKIGLDERGKRKVCPYDDSFVHKRGKETDLAVFFISRSVYYTRFQNYASYPTIISVQMSAENSKPKQKTF